MRTLFFASIQQHVLSSSAGIPLPAYFHPSAPNRPSLWPHLSPRLLPSSPLPPTVVSSAAPRCGFDDMVPKLWVERINAVIPDLGFHVRWHGLWMEVAEGRVPAWMM